MRSRSLIATSSRLQFCFWGLLLTCFGCASGGLKTYPVTGEVEFEDGVALQGGIVEFTAIKQQISSQGFIGLDGTFHLSTIRDGDGAVEGEHRAIVMFQFADGLVKHQHDAKTFRRPDNKYASYQTSNLKFTVQASQKNHIKITVGQAK